MKFFAATKDYTDLTTDGYKHMTIIEDASMIHSNVFNVRGKSDALVILHVSPTHYYEITIGGWDDNRSVIRFFKGGKSKSQHERQHFLEIHEEPNLLDENAFHHFWVSWWNNTIRVGECCLCIKVESNYSGFW